MVAPFKHISIRVPWHDTGWDGRVCLHPSLNGSCLKLKRIGQERNDEEEERVAGRSLNELAPEKWPCCVAERMAFMAPFDYHRVTVHPYTRTSQKSHGHFAPTTLRYPAYSAPAVPFAWLLKENLSTLGEEFGINVRAEREPDLGFKTQWIQHRDNQSALLDYFRSQIRPQHSLCFFYAKRAPFMEDPGMSRILIGVGRVLSVSPCVEYEYSTKDLHGRLRSVLWELMVQHSIRPDFQDGFILPYHAAIQLAEDNSEYDPSKLAALTPDDRLLEFSHASQHVTHDGAIACLLAMAESLREAQTTLPGPWASCLTWIDQRLDDLWIARGPFPGLGSALCAFGVELGTFVALALMKRLAENSDPWILVDQLMREPGKYLPNHLAKTIDLTKQAHWSQLPKERRDLLKLISRFEVTKDQARLIYAKEDRGERGLNCSDSNILANPYLVYQMTRLNSDSISLWTVDRGVFPDEVVRAQHPLPTPTALNSGTDARRVGALVVKILEDEAAIGNTLMPQDRLVTAVRNLNIKPECYIDGDLLNVAKKEFEGTIIDTKMADGSNALQLDRLSEVAEIIRSFCNKRIEGKRLAVEADWRGLLNCHLDRKGVGILDELEENARVEKTAALKELAESRISVLIGPAGTGKTTLLSILCSHPQISEGDILLLAPTGKARVRIEQSSDHLNLKGYTVAQFLSPHRYDPVTGRYLLSDKVAEAGARTVIVDEASMLTEEMLAALIQALTGVHRLILIGDPRQLPPIGSGRPFVDIINRLAPENIADRFPRVGRGYAELTIRRRQAGVERDDIQLAEWFSGSPMPPGEDDVFENVTRLNGGGHVGYVRWETAEELKEKLLSTIINTLGMNGLEDIQRFDESLGGKDWNGLRFFNCGSAIIAENWQVLSPVRSGPHGVPDINRLLHKKFRQHFISASIQERNRRYPKPMGHEQIVYGDKVINLVNTDCSLPWNRHRSVYPPKPKPYVANGEIGVVIGYFWTNEHRNRGLDFRKKMEVEFSSQPGFKYDYTGKDFSEEANPALELAYALTVHKAQGSEFGTVILVLPNPCRLLSRELLYTALTRQRERVIILHQGPRSELRKYSSDDHSDTARRITNLFIAPSLVEMNGRFYEERLIHRTSRGEMVRSKSEVIIADRLASFGVAYQYERPLSIDRVTKYPDFTIEDMDTGRNFYWEHCGMLMVPSYRRNWEDKLKWYRANQILPHDEGEGERGTLIVTQDSPEGGISSQDIEQVIRKLILER